MTPTRRSIKYALFTIQYLKCQISINISITASNIILYYVILKIIISCLENYNAPIRLYLFLSYNKLPFTVNYIKIFKIFWSFELFIDISMFFYSN